MPPAEGWLQNFTSASYLSSDPHALCLQPTTLSHLDVLEFLRLAGTARSSRTWPTGPLPDASGSSSPGRLLLPPGALCRNLEIALDTPMCSAVPAQPLVHSVIAARAEVQVTTAGHSDRAETAALVSCSPCVLSCPPSNPIRSPRSSQKGVMLRPTSLAPQSHNVSSGALCIELAPTSPGSS